jgi:energy-coupling factor transporter ATP-binding protein EcfA2
MLDFLVISTRSTKRGVIEIFPKFVVNKKSDLMIRGSDFYAVWDEEKHLWSTDESDVVRMVDQESNAYAKAHKDSFEGSVKVLNMWDSSTGMIDSWHHYCQKQCRDNYHMLDEKLIFSDTDTKKEDYASKKLDYPLKPGDISGYDDLMSVLYSPEERKKIEWAIGAVVNGDSKTIQKFLVLYGASGTGKSTVLNIIQQLFDGYYCVFDAKALGSANAAFALEPFKSNPLVAIQHDGDLSRIEDNTRLNSLVSHEIMTVNEKFKSTYANRFKCFLFMGTNKPVKITDAKSGIIRRLIDVQPTGDKVPLSRYRADVKKIKFELGAIACHCRDVYMADPNAYDNYIPINMLGASNDFYNFIEDSYDDFKRENGTTLKAAWESYKKYCTDANVTYPYSQRAFKEELKNYFKVFLERSTLSDGSSVRNYYSQFKFNPGTIVGGEAPKEEATKSWLDLSETESIFDKEFADCFAVIQRIKRCSIQHINRC